MVLISVFMRTALFVLPTVVSATGDLGFSLGVKLSPVSFVPQISRQLNKCFQVS